MHLLLQLVRGFLVGLAGLLPGLCGSTLLVLFGLYRPLAAALAHPVTGFRRNLLPFAPFFLAAGAGILAGSRLLVSVFVRHEVPMLYLFMGFMLGALPDLARPVRHRGGGTKGATAFAGMLLLCLGLALLQSRLVPRAAALEEHWGIWLAAGAGIGLGSIIPGASIAFLLIYFGLYPSLLAGVAGLDPRILGPVILGAGTAILMFARAADWLFRKAEGPATGGVLGLVAGSLWLAFPGWPGGARGFRCLFLLGLGFVLSAGLNRLAPPPVPAPVRPPGSR